MFQGSKRAKLKLGVVADRVQAATAAWPPHGVRTSVLASPVRPRQAPRPPRHAGALPLSLISPRARYALSSLATSNTASSAAYSTIVAGSFSNQPRPQLHHASLYLLQCLVESFA
jgi:hypothetical protein